MNHQVSLNENEWKEVVTALGHLWTVKKKFASDQGFWTSHVLNEVYEQLIRSGFDPNG